MGTCCSKSSYPFIRKISSKDVEEVKEVQKTPKIQKIQIELAKPIHEQKFINI